MSRWLQFLLFLLGTVLFGNLVAVLGPGRLWSDAMTTGWMIVPIVLLYGGVYVCEAGSLQIILSEEPARPRFRRTLATVVAGAALNSITPVINVGGEPYKVVALAPSLGTRRAAGSIILHTMLRTLGQLLVFLTALVLGLVLLPSGAITTGLLIGGMAVIGILAATLFAAHQRGGFAPMLDRMSRLPGLSRVARRLEPKRPALVDIDTQIRDFYRKSRRRFWSALGLQYASRCVFMLEFCLIGVATGVKIGYAQAFAIGGLEALASNALFFVPFELGTRESAIVILFQQLGFQPGLGLYAALVGRVRDVLWIGFGIVLIWAQGRGRALAEPSLESVAP
ncbi:MAG: lysylphosphatidylglycerol synthase transmembrane domain-containing protein [Gemmatimonadota bacterium]